MRGRRWLVLPAVALLGGLWAAGLTSASDQTVTADPDGMTFSRSQVTIEVGDTVTVTKAAGSYEHNVVWEDQQPYQACPGGATTEAWTCKRTFTDTGSIYGMCTTHGPSGMIFFVNVKEAAATPRPTRTPAPPKTPKPTVKPTPAPANTPNPTMAPSTGGLTPAPVGAPTASSTTIAPAPSAGPSAATVTGSPATPQPSDPVTGSGDLPILPLALAFAAIAIGAGAGLLIRRRRAA
jgi:plastocyanin